MRGYIVLRKMTAKFSLLRRVIREMIDSESLVFYHGTTKDAIPSIMNGGLQATKGWGGASNPGVFLSKSVENARYWSKMSLLKKLGLPYDESNFGEVAEDEITVFEVRIPADHSGDVIKRNASFSLAGDMQFVGSVPTEWLSLIVS